MTDDLRAALTESHRAGDLSASMALIGMNAASKLLAASMATSVLPMLGRAAAAGIELEQLGEALLAAGGCGVDVDEWRAATVELNRNGWPLMRAARHCYGQQLLKIVDRAR